MGWVARVGLGALVAGAALWAAVATPAASAERRAYGQQLVGRYQLAPQAIARYAALAAGQGEPESTPRGQSMLADNAPWIGPLQRAGAGHNPYTIVLTVSGVARSAGDVLSHWQAAWEVSESPVASREVLAPVARTTHKALAAGEPLSLTTHSAPVSFRGERAVAPVLGLVQTRNLDITAVEVEVWSGSVPLALPSWPVAPTAWLALTGVGGVFFVLRRRGEASAAPVVAVRASRLPPVIEAPAPVVEAPPPRPDHVRRVRDSLMQILAGGLAVPTEFDDTRPPRRKLKAAPASR